jgi:HK97 family phage major capsid protein
MKHNFFAWRHLDPAPDATKGGSTEIVLKAINDNAQKTKEQIDGVKTEVNTNLEKAKTEINGKVDDLDTRVTEVKAAQQKHEDAITEVKQKLATVTSLNTKNKGEEKLFNDIITETIEANIEKIKGHKRGQGSMIIRLKGFEDENVKEVKAVGDMSAANFTGIAEYVTDRRSTIVQTPYNRVYLSDILPNGSGSGKSVLYPKENGGEGAAALWTDSTADKPQMDFDLTTQQAFFKWIAGYVIVDRETLDDVDFMLSYIQRKMLISLKAAENDFILNGSTDTNPVSGLLDLATAYNGTFTAGVDKVVDAGWGQIVEDTNDFYNPTDALLYPRDAVAIGLNKASGSGEYNLPLGSVGFVNGKLTIAGLQATSTTQIGSGNFLVFDRNALMFIRRMNPELRIFEDSTLAKKNKIMFRIEERATLIGFNNNAIVSGTLA